MTLAPGATVGRYQILAPLGHGGMATVYKAYQPSLDREVALKVLRPGYAQDAEFLERFEREAKSIAKLRHPNIVQVFDFEAVEGQYALAMEFLEGGTLKERLASLAKQGEGMDPREIGRIVGEVADALSYAHELGIVHRDIKPSNVMLTRRDRAVVTDFGIARILGATSHTQTGVGIGTPEYMAPEQGQGTKVDHRADIYSLGAMAYELLTGRVPFLADTPLAVVLAHLKDPLPLPSAINPAIGQATERALLRALAKDPEQRFASATDFADALRAGIDEAARGGTVPTMVVRGARVSRGVRPARAASVGATLAADIRQRPLVAAGLAAGALVMVGAIAAIALGVFAGPRAAPVSAVGPSPGTTSTINPATIPKGALYWEAKLDGTDGDIQGGSLRKGSAVTTIATNNADDAAVLRPRPGALELVNQQPAGAIGFSFNSTPRRSYIAEFDIAFSQDTKIISNWTVRTGTGQDGRQTFYVLRLAPSAEQAYFYFVPSRGAQAEPLSASAKVPGLGSGRQFTITLVVEDARVTLFVDGKSVTQFADDKMPTALTRPFVSAIGDHGATGVLRITRAHFFEIAGG